MRIGELGRRSGLAPTALRYYEQLGLLPEPERTPSGYRSYADPALDRLAFIRSAQAVGLTLAEVREVLGVRDAGEAPCRVVTAMIDRRHAEVRSRIAELRVLERDLARLRDRAARLEPRDCDPSGVCHVIPKDTPGGRGNSGTEIGVLQVASELRSAIVGATLSSGPRGRNPTSSIPLSDIGSSRKRR